MAARRARCDLYQHFDDWDELSVTQQERYEGQAMDETRAAAQILINTHELKGQ
ncbi:MAG: hypothetical protein UY48_C0008G0024 [Candidatus Gottesmanbacteria bacterium GW2011_GWB1_49_7]|uniref:Uncharacterized protein n=1 Tax=Candidatus Gottesmanbacteria bacterium GW2011_GWB1_49_7 TaxID=1618448 RepID=A0A0G1Z272_9BACT|nr:MAG: hypothetical protein UY48_C0008G0024 [Candidatus Gottesmanbacteria bacterium GW2011_GWB1_49_7]